MRQLVPSSDPKLYLCAAFMFIRVNDGILIGCIYRSDSSTHDNNEKLLDLLNEMTETKFSWLIMLMPIMGAFN